MTDAPDGIAIIGMSGRFPGARNVAEFWQNLLAGAETISTIAGPAPDGAGNYVPRRGLIERPEWFDAAFFGMSPREAEVTDPQQRIFLEECWTALEDAACDPSRFQGAIGVYAGMTNNTYWQQNVAHHPELIESVGWLTAMMGNEKDYLATRVAYKLNLRGPALNIYTACSTSLVAVCQAVQGLLNFNCDVALAGGVSVTFPHERGYFHTDGGIVSPDGHCRAFDAKSAGTVFSNGVGVVVLKRLADAIAARDPIYAVIRGAALNNDGSDKVSFTAPSVEGHTGVIALAHALADVEPRSIGYIEAHGTGTPLGDPIEIAGLTQAFRAGTQDTGFCAIGSLKTNIGHLDAAAGIAGLIKAALCVKHGKIPPSLHFTTPNPQLGIEDSPFFVADRLMDWPENTGPRRCGVSSFGVGGTNAHCVLEEFDAPDREEARTSPTPLILPISAKTETALAQIAANLADHLEQQPQLSLCNVAHTLQAGRAALNHRRAFVATSREVAISALRGFEPKQTHSGEAGTGGVVFMFPGQGAQYAGMGASLYLAEPAYREALDECCELLRPTLGLDLRSLLHPADSDRDRASSTLRETRYTQPAIFAVSYALARLWMSWGIKPSACIGHSVGEYVAATLAGVFTLPDALRLVAARAQLVNDQPGGAMLAVRLSEEDARVHANDRIALAAVNAPKLCVLAGPDDAIATLESRLAQDGIAAKRLETSHAFHSAMMDAVIEPLAEIAAGIPRNPPSLPVLSTVTGGWLGADEATDPRYWARHARETVRFSPAIAALLSGENRIYLECGPGQTLTQLARQHRPENCAILSSIHEGGDEVAGLRGAAAQLWTRGCLLDWSALAQGRTHARVPLPTYPFDRKRYFADAPATQPAPLAQPARNERATTEAQPVEIAPDTSETRPVRLQREITAVLESLSGSDLAGMDPKVSFLELGFDSLFLTQAAVALFKRFGVKITFRQLLQDLPSPELLAAHLDTVLPQTAHTQPAAKNLTTQPAAPVSAPARAHGPFRGIDRGSTEITAEQRSHLDALIARYTARTTGSKKFTAMHRAHLADPRAVAGFRREWKEIVYPLVCERSEGSRLWDADDNEYVDITLGFGQILFGHRPAWLVEAIEKQLHTGIEIGPTSPLAGTLAARLGKFLGLDRVAFCNTGSEAVAAALRIARTVSGRDRVVVFSGAYHGIFDEVLFRPGPMPIAPGIPQSAVQNLVVLDYGTEQSLEWLRTNAHDLAAVLIEPVQSRHPALMPREFLHEIRRITSASGVALILDEIVTGFRLAPRGAQEYFGISADIATYGKIIGGGMPVGIVAGSTQYMDALDGGAWRYGDDSFPEIGVTFFAGTFVRHPLALAAASAVLTQIEAGGAQLQKGLADKTGGLVARMNGHLDRIGVPLRWEQCTSLYYLPLPPELRFAPLLFHHMRIHGIHVWENRPCFLSAAHSDADIAAIASAFEESVDALVRVGLLPAHAPAGLAGSADTFPLTDAQQEIHLATRLGAEASAAFNDAIRLSIRGSLSLGTMRSALARLVDRHEALRTTFLPDGTAQRVTPGGPGELLFEDYSDEPVSSRDMKIAALAERFSVTPFDLGQGPLFRAALVRLGADDHALIFCAHHIVCDGWSFGLVASDLAALCAEENPALPEPFTMRAYERLQQESRHTREFAQAEDWWLRQFENPPPLLDLPTDRPRPPHRTFNANTATSDFPADLCLRLRQLASARRSTLFPVLFGAFATLLHRLSGQSDIVIGIAGAGQAQIEAPLVGHCVNFLPLRLRVADDLAFGDFLQAINDLVLDAQEQQQVTFGRLIQKLSLPREQGRMPLVSVSFNMDRASGPLSFGSAEAELMPLAKQRYHLDLSFNLVESGEGLRLFCHFNTDLFDPATIERWMKHYSTLLSGIADSPATTLSELPLLTAAETAQILVEWNDTSRGYPRDSGVDDLFEDIVAQQPNSPAITDGDQILTYGRLNSEANMLAHRLADSGVAPGSLIGICLERSAGLVIAMLAVVKAGCAYVPLDPSWPSERVQFMSEDGALATIVTTLEFARLFSGATTLLDAPQPVLKPSTTNPTAPTDGATRAYVMYTSGSTGTPKGVVIPHRAISRLVINTNYVRLTANDTVGHASNPAFDAATFEIWGPLLNGGQVVVLKKDTLLDPSRLAAAIRDNGITTMFLTTALFNQIAATAPGTFSDLHHLLVGGEAHNPGSVRKVLESSPPRRFLNIYGPTETTTFAVSHHVTDLPQNATAIPIGRPIANTTAYILDARTRPVPIGVPGELFLGGDGLAIGYLARPDLTAERFVPHPFEEGALLYRTGDLTCWRPGGAIEFLGRMDSQVKLRGFRVEPGEIEAELRRHPAIREAAVVLHTNPAGDKSLVAYIATESADDFSQFLRRRLPDYMIPATFMRLEKLPLTANGKLDRRALPAPSRGGPAADDTPRNETETRIAELMAAVLGLPRVPVHEDFFRLGGHSLLAMDLLARVRKAFGVEITAAQLFDGPSVAALAEKISPRNESVTPPQATAFEFLVPIQRGDAANRPLFLVAGGWGGEIEFLVYAPIARHLGPSQPIYGLKAKGAGTSAPPHASVAEMAADYIREIRAIQPAGPYRIAGECVGGICAHEIACQLTDAGQEVEMLLLLDTSVPDPRELAGYLAAEERKIAVEQVTPKPAGRIRHHLEKMSGLSLGGKARYLLEKASRSRRKPATQQHPRGQAAYPPTLMSHKLRAYPGHVILLVDEESSRLYGTLGWEKAAIGSLHCEVLPGDHISYIREHSESAARKLRELLLQHPKHQ